MARSVLEQLSRNLYKASRTTRDVNAVEKSIATGSLAPIAKREANKWIGRKIVSKLWFR